MMITLKAEHKLSKSQTISQIGVTIPFQNELIETKDGYILHENTMAISSHFPYAIRVLKVVREAPNSSRAKFQITTQNNHQLEDLSLTNLLKYALKAFDANNKSRTSPSDLVLCWWYAQLFFCGTRNYKSFAGTNIESGVLSDFLKQVFDTLSTQMSEKDESNKLVLHSYLRQVKLMNIDMIMRIVKEISTFDSKTNEKLEQFFDCVVKLPYNVKRYIFHIDNKERGQVLDEISKVLCEGNEIYNVGTIGMCKMSVVPRKKRKREPKEFTIDCPVKIVEKSPQSPQSPQSLQSTQSPQSPQSLQSTQSPQSLHECNEKNECNECGQVGAEYWCCEDVYYCSEQCQKEEWPTHEKECTRSQKKAKLTDNEFMNETPTIQPEQFNFFDSMNFNFFEEQEDFQL